jgi:hypothetical protein
MKVMKLSETNEFKSGAMKRFILVQDSEFFKIINFNLEAGVTFPVHSHDLDGDLSVDCRDLIPRRCHVVLPV